MRYMLKKLKIYDEEYIKGWKITKINKNNLKRKKIIISFNSCLEDRFFILTDKNYYTIRFDFKRDVIDKKHTKGHPLHQIFLLESGIFVHTGEPVVCIYTSEKTANRRRKSFRYLPNKDTQAQKDRVRPNTDGCYVSQFVSPQEIKDPKEKRRFLAEFMYTVYGVVNYSLGQPMLEPFLDQRIKIRSSVAFGSFLYNKLKLGRFK